MKEVTSDDVDIFQAGVKEVTPDVVDMFQAVKEVTPGDVMFQAGLKNGHS